MLTSLYFGFEIRLGLSRSQKILLTCLSLAFHKFQLAVSLSLLPDQLEIRLRFFNVTVLTLS